MNVTRITAAGALIAAMLLLAPVAHAEPDVGSLVCQLLALGESPAQVAELWRNGSPAISRLAALAAVRAVAAERCSGPTVLY
jgi:hypothetical protein